MLGRPCLTIVLFALACQKPEPQEITATLGGNTVARVGAELISEETVLRIARTRGISIREARDRAVVDALFAEHARSRGALDAQQQSAVLARALLEKLQAEAIAEGPVTDEERNEAATRRWYEVARPAGSWVAKIEVTVSDTAATGSKQRAEALLERMRQTLAAELQAVREQAALDPKAGLDPTTIEQQPRGRVLLSRVRELPSEGFEVVGEEQPPFDTQGLTVLPGNRVQLGPELADAAQKLLAPGDATKPIATPGGVALFVLLGRTEASQLTMEEQNKRLAEEIVAKRTRSKINSLLESLATSNAIEVDRRADGLLSLVQLGASP